MAGTAISTLRYPNGRVKRFGEASGQWRGTRGEGVSSFLLLPQRGSSLQPRVVRRLGGLP